MSDHKESIMENPLALLMNHRLFMSSCAVDHCLVMNVLDLVRTRAPSQKGVSLSE